MQELQYKLISKSANKLAHFQTRIGKLEILLNLDPFIAATISKVLASKLISWKNRGTCKPSFS